MNQATNLPNLGKQLKKFIGKVMRENEEVQKRFMEKDYVQNLYGTRYIGGGSRLYITEDVHEAFQELLKKIELVFNAEKVKYDIDQVESRLAEFITDIVCNKKTYDLNMINGFIEKLKVPDYVCYFFRLFNFEYKEKVNIGSDIMVIKGEELLKDIPEDLNNKAEKNPIIKTIIDPKDTLLGVSVISTGKSDRSYYCALESAQSINNAINFLNGFNHKSSRVLELSQHIIQEDGIYKFTKRNDHFSNKQYSGVLEGSWRFSTRVMKDKRPKVNLDFDDRWLSKIPLIIDDSKELSPLQRQCARAIDWIGDGIVNSNQTKQFLQIIISLETVIEQDPNKLKRKLEKDSLWKDCLSVSIEDQLVSIIDLLCYHGLPQQQITKNNKEIKNAYSLRSQITHDGKQLKKGDSTHLLNRWYGIAYTIISNIIFSGQWNNVYDLWKAANLKL